MAQLREGIEGLFQQKKVDLIRGKGTIIAPGTVSVGDRKNRSSCCVQKG